KKQKAEIESIGSVLEHGHQTDESDKGLDDVTVALLEKKLLVYGCPDYGGSEENDDCPFNVLPGVAKSKNQHAPSKLLVYLTPPLEFYAADKGLRMFKPHCHVKVVELVAFSDPHTDTSLITICTPLLCGVKAGQYLFLR
ncbi:hypothetical protein HDU99_006747, partial [Rhizoclosmatium hyalinum]